MYMDKDLREQIFVCRTSTEGTEEENSAFDLTNSRCIYCATKYREYQSSVHAT